MTGAPSGPVVFVDALNVARSTWPNIAADRLVALCRLWAEEAGCDVLIVFDGRAPAASGDSRVDVLGTGAETADDWIAREAGGRASEGRAYWLVTSDRELRVRAGERAERTIGGGRFARELLALEARDSPPSLDA